jgi:GMP synthase-like glutamine amidotransferase
VTRALVLQLTVTAAARSDPVFGALGDEFPALQWHGDTFGIPAGAVHLAGSSAYPHQAFRFGAAAYAVQFHVEVTGRMLAEWRHVPAYEKSARAVLGPSGGRVATRWRAFRCDQHVNSQDTALSHSEHAAMR